MVTFRLPTPKGLRWQPCSPSFFFFFFPPRRWLAPWTSHLVFSQRVFRGREPVRGFVSLWGQMVSVSPIVGNNPPTCSNATRGPFALSLPLFFFLSTDPPNCPPSKFNGFWHPTSCFVLRPTKKQISTPFSPSFSLPPSYAGRSFP